jgi:AraC-like DNA-binding protein
MGYSPQRALWLPPLMEHSYRLLSHTELRAVYLSRSLISECTHFTKNDRVHVIDAVPLVKELIAGLFISDYHTLTKRKMALLLLDIIGEAASVPAELPMPRDDRLFRAAGELMLSHRWETSLTDMADIANMSERSFSRLFLRDTGFSFRTWKQRAEYTHHWIFFLKTYLLNRLPGSLVFLRQPHFLLHFAQLWA